MNMMRGKPIGSHCKMGSFPPGAPLGPYPGFAASNLALAQGVIAGISLSGTMLSAPPLPWYCQTPDKSCFGAGEVGDFGAVCCGVAWARSTFEKVSAAVKQIS